MTQVFAPMLVVGAIALYVLDSVMLLYGNEFVLVRRSGRWRLAKPGALEFSSRRLYVPNPLTPHRPLFRLHWKLADGGEGDADRAAPSQDEFLKAVSIVGLGVVPLMVVLALGPVLVALGFASPEYLLAWMAVAYLDVLCLLALVYRSRAALGLSNREFSSLAMESILCVPFALNLVRKISERRGPRSDPLEFAARVLDDTDSQHLITCREDMRTRLQ